MSDFEEFEEFGDDEIDFKGGFFHDDGTPINAEFVVKPPLCLTCSKDDTDPFEEILCTLNRLDQEDSDEGFRCGSYQKKITL